MTRSILTTAALAACLTAGVPLAAPSTPRERETRSSARAAAQAAPEPLVLAGRLLAVHCAGPRAPGGPLGVAVLADAPLAHGALQLWAGRKNGWGSPIAVAAPVAGHPGLLAASVALPDPLPAAARLWLALARDPQRAALASLPLPDAYGTA